MLDSLSLTSSWQARIRSEQSRMVTGLRWMVFLAICCHVCIGEYSTTTNVDGGVNGITIQGRQTGSNLGYVVGGCDLNNDGYDEIFASSQADGKGYVKVFYGGPSMTDIVSGATSAPRFTYWGEDGNTGYEGYAVACGDFNNDGFDDLLLGVPSFTQAGRTFCGAVHVIRGKNTQLTDMTHSSFTPSAANGYTIYGYAANNYFGASVADIGDINADGKNDFVVGSPGTPSTAGSVVVVLGSTRATDLDMSGFSEGTHGYYISKLAIGENFGFSVAGIGRFNGDAYPDIAIGCPQCQNGAGSLYVIYGGGALTSINAGTLTASQGCILNGIGKGQLGYAVQGAGDFNGDGYADVIIGAPNTNRTGNGQTTETGAAYVFYGKSARAMTNSVLTLITDGFPIMGPLGTVSKVGQALGRGMDINGDGLSDQLIGAPKQNVYGLNAGVAYVLFGRRSSIYTPIDLTGFEEVPTWGYRITGAAFYGQFGGSVAFVPDVNGDRVVDIVIGARMADSLASPGSGVVYVLHGQLANYTLVDVTTLWADGRGFQVTGEVANGRTGKTVAGNCNVNGDAFRDVVVGSPEAAAAGPMSGIVHVLFGHSRATAAFPNLALNTFTAGALGFRIYGAGSNHKLGSSVACGDVNNDGFDEMLLGAPGDGGNGAVYVIFGHGPGYTWADIQLNGWSNAASRGFRVYGESGVGGTFGLSISFLGRFDGDSFNDFIIGAQGYTSAEKSQRGQALVMYGSSLSSNVDPGAYNSRGFRVLGAQAGNKLGISVSGAGDINNDGYDDYIVGAPMYTGNDPQSGMAYVGFGSAVKSYTEVDLSATVSSDKGFFIGGTAGSWLGYSVGRAGDVNQDGIDDLLVGAPFYSDLLGKRGAVNVLFGQENGGAWVDVYTHTGLTEEQGFRMFGRNNSAFGTAVGGVGDVNGDGLDDFAVGAVYEDYANRVDCGGAYVVFGRSGATVVADYDMQQSFQSGRLGYRVVGTGSTAYLGGAIAGAGDFNGDGVDDVWVGAERAGVGSPGQAYMIYGWDGSPRVPTPAPTRAPTGKPVREFPLTSVFLPDLPPSRGITFTGAQSGDYLGTAVTGIGDFNRDGYDDVLIGAKNSQDPYLFGGAAYVVFGNQSDWALTDLSAFTSGRRGFRIRSGVSVTELGYAVAKLGDVNLDGWQDFAVSAPRSTYSTRTECGIVYVFFGHSGPYTDLNLDTFTSGPLGYRILGAEAGFRMGMSIAGVPDFNEDGRPDLLVGAPFAGENNRAGSGTAYIIWGRTTATSADVDTISMLTTTGGLRFYGAEAEHSFGMAVSSAGDFNGDGKPDLMFAATGASTVYVAFNGIQLTGTDMSTFAAAQVVNAKGAMFVGAAGGSFGAGMAGVGDVNGDGRDDIVVSAPNQGGNGVVFVIYGTRPAAGRYTVLTMSTSFYSGTDGYFLTGLSTGAGTGSRVRALGDINGDGVKDFAIGSPGYTVGMSTAAGVVHIVFGTKPPMQAYTSINLATTFSISRGFVIWGSVQNGRVGSSIGLAGDFDGDGIADLIVGAETADAAGKSLAGQAFLVYGTREVPTSQPSQQPTGQPSRQPSRQPTSQPSGHPTSQPTSQPSRQPSRQPSSQPSRQPTSQPSTRPTGQPTRQPTAQPTSQPSSKPSGQPSRQPSRQPSGQPTNQPSRQPTTQPSAGPTGQPTRQPSRQPSNQPSSQPSQQPTSRPSAGPTGQPTRQPSAKPTSQPSSRPSGQPTRQPSRQPSNQPSSQPSRQPTAQPSAQPSGRPTNQPTRQPTSQPTVSPTGQPTTRPSAQPSCRPTGQPTREPTGQPTGSPTGQPSRQPTHRPSGQPSTTPSAQPTVSPTSQPSVQPSGQPTLVPSAQPSAVPSAQPSSPPTCQPSCAPSAQPSSSPTAQPSGSPTTQPSATPTAQPTDTPTMQPSAAPSGQPTGVPSAQPTGQPSFVPSSQPSAQPSSQPTGEPTAQPSMQPSSHPSAQPSGVPSSQPSSQPSGQPSGEPTSQPTAQPSGEPTSQPSTQPTATPTNQPTALPSGQPSSTPTCQPTVAPSAQPTGRPSVQPSSVPTGQPTTDPSAQPSAVPSGQPTSEPSSQPTAAPSAQPTTQPTSTPTAQPSSQPSTAPTPLYNASRELTPAVAPNITRLAVDAVNQTEVSARVFVEGRGDVLVYCAAFSPVTQRPASVQEVVGQNLFAQVRNGYGVVVLRNLAPATDYAIYCATSSLQGRLAPYSAVLRHIAEARTLCCKSLRVDVLLPTLREHTSTDSAVVVSADYPPSSSMAVTLTVSGSSGIMPYPATTEFLSTDRAGTAKTFRLTAGSAGADNQLSVSLSGAAAAEYNVIYTNPRTVAVLSASEEPPVPVPVSAQFSGDGTAVAVAFSAPTDRAGYRGTFPCPTLLSFTGSAQALCQWADASTITLYPRYTSATAAQTLAVGHNLTVLEGAVRAKCTSTVTTICTQWRTVPNTVLRVIPPANPVTPVPALSVPSALGACGTLKVDLTNSVGSAGRVWSKFSFKVLTSAGQTVAATRLEQYLNANFTYSPPTVVPSYALARGYTYTIQTTVCNFLGACGTAVKVVTVQSGMAALPVVSISGQAQRSLTRSTPLTVSAFAYTEDCSGTVSYSRIAYDWTVSVVSDGTGELVPTGLKSVSQSPSTFKLPAYSLTAGSRYVVQVTATSSAALQASAAVEVAVVPGNVVGSIAQGATMSVMAGNATSLDASASYDEDVPGLKGAAAGLTFTWACIQVLPAFSPNCSTVTLSTSGNGEVLTLTTMQAAADSTFRVAMTVTASGSGGRSSTAFTDVTATREYQPELRITNAPSTLTAVSAHLKLNLFGSIRTAVPCTAQWSLDDSSTDLQAIAQTAVARAVVPQHPVAFTPFNLVVAGEALAERSSYGFSLTCGAAHTSVTVTTNGAPLPGEFLLSPSTGLELSTRFTFSAVQWTDPELPLTYQFGYSSPESLSDLVIVSATEQTSATSVLPKGSALHGHQVQCLLTVFDSLGAAVKAHAVAIVTGLPAESRDEQLSQLIEASAEASVNDMKRTISIVSSTLNQADCTAAPNCMALHRLACSRTSGVCGVCQLGYIGDAGDSNQPCIPAESLAMSDTNRACVSDADCVHGQVCDSAGSGKCVFPRKSCLDDCSGHGSCVAVDLASGQVRQTPCGVDDVTCEASCVCVRPYTGRACEIDLPTLATNRRARSAMISTLLDLTATEDVNVQSVSDWSSSLYALTLNPYELSANDVQKVVTVANRTLAGALEVGSTDAESLLGILQATDTAASMQKHNYNPNDYQDLLTDIALVYRNNTAEGIVTVASAFADLVTGAKVLGEEETTYLFDNFRVSAQLYIVSAQAGNLSLTAPQTAAEKYADRSMSYAVVTPSPTEGTETVVAAKVIAVHPQAYTPDTRSFFSSPLYLQLHPEGGRPDAHMVASIEFAFPHNEAIPALAHPTAENFTSTCRGGQVNEEYSYTCPGSNAVLQNNCSRGAGTYVQYCPGMVSTCASVALGTAELRAVSDCAVTSFNATYTHCRCTLGETESPPSDEASSSSRRLTSQRRLVSTSETDVLDETGVTNMVATSKYIALEFADTFNAAEKFNSPDTVVIVIYMFATVWGAGMLLLTVCVSRSYVSKWEKAKQLSSKVAAAVDKMQSAAVVGEAKKCLMDYVESVIPSVYDGSKGTFGRMLGELRAHHRYLSLFTLGDGRLSVYSKMALIGKVLTVETMQMFVLGVLYDIEEPSDDGSCRNLVTETDCLSRKAIMDNTQTYCDWNDTTNKCYYHNQDFSFRAFIYILILTSIFTSIINTPLDYLIKVCTAPLISKAMQAQVAQSERQGRRRSSVMRGVRRVSAVTSEAVQAARRQTVRLAKSVSSRVMDAGHFLFSAATGAERVIANRDIPEDLEHLHHQAVAVLPSLSINADSLLRQRSQHALSMKNRAMSRRLQSQKQQFVKDFSDAVSIDSDGQVAVRAASLTSTEKEEKAVHDAALTSAATLCEEVIAQREILPRDSLVTQAFDQEWGIETLLVDVGKDIQRVSYEVSAEARGAIYEDIRASDRDAAELNETLPRYTVQHGGLAILNLFLLDLLGRNTVAARIFRNKFEEDFEQTRAVSLWFQVFAIAVLVVANTFFIYYSLLKAFQQGTAWQYQYLRGCIVQAVVEILLNETLECVWLNYLVPDLVRKEVKKATEVVRAVVDQITTAAPVSSAHSVLFLDSTQYLFSSTKVARAHPTLLESIVVLHYRSHLPGELNRLWPHRRRRTAEEEAQAAEQTVFERAVGCVPALILSASTSIVLMLQWLGTLPFGTQRVVLRVIQPLLLSGLTLLWFTASASTAGLIIIATGTVVALSTFAWRQYYVYKTERKSQNSVLPGADDPLLLIDDSDAMEDIESLPGSRSCTPKSGGNVEADHVSPYRDRDLSRSHSEEEVRDKVRDSKPTKTVVLEQSPSHPVDPAGTKPLRHLPASPNHAMEIQSLEESKNDCSEGIEGGAKARTFSFFDSDDSDDDFPASCEPSSSGAALQSQLSPICVDSKESKPLDLARQETSAFFDDDDVDELLSAAFAASSVQSDQSIAGAPSNTHWSAAAYLAERDGRLAGNTGGSYTSDATARTEPQPDAPPVAAALRQNPATAHAQKANGGVFANETGPVSTRHSHHHHQPGFVHDSSDDSSADRRVVSSGSPQQPPRSTPPTAAGTAAVPVGPRQVSVLDLSSDSDASTDARRGATRDVAAEAKDPGRQRTLSFFDSDEN